MYKYLIVLCVVCCVRATENSHTPVTDAGAASGCQGCECCNSVPLFLPSMSYYEDLNTNDGMEYHFFPVTNRHVHFKVKASYNANIALTREAKKQDPMIEVFIGAYDNTKSVIRRDRTKPDKAEVDSPDILSSDEFRGFWVSWHGGVISVGREGVDSPFMSWSDPNPLPIAFVGVRTGWGATGSWIVEVPKAVSS